MRLPWVSRAHYELLEHNYGELREFYGDIKKALDESFTAEARLIGTLSRAEVRFDRLLDKFCAMKLAGGVVVDTPTQIERKEQDEVTRRINILSVGRPGLRAQMLKQVDSDRTLLGLDDVAIMQRIEAGVTSDDGVIA